MQEGSEHPLLDVGQVWGTNARLQDGEQLLLVGRIGVLVDRQAKVVVDLFPILGGAPLEPARVRIDKGPEDERVAIVSRMRVAGSRLDEGRAEGAGRTCGEAQRPKTLKKGTARGRGRTRERPIGRMIHRHDSLCSIDSSESPGLLPV